MALSQIKTNSIAASAITSALIADGTVVAADIAANSVDSSELVDGSVDFSHMSVNSINSDQYVDGSIDTAHIAASQITNALMADDAIDSAEIVAGSIDNAHVAAGLDAVKLADGSVTNAELQYINSLSANAQTQITARLPLAGGTMSGETIFADQLVTRPVLKDYGETKVAMAAHAVDLSLGNVQTYTLSGNQSLTFTNPPATGTSGSFTLIVTNGGSATLTWPSSVTKWAGGTAPSLTSSGTDVIVFTTIDAGTKWYGFAAGLAMA